MDFGTSEEHQPVTWVRGHPVYAAYFVALVFTVSMVVTTLCMAFHFAAYFSMLPFSSGRVLAGEAWRLVTYGLVNPPSLWFAVDMIMIAWFGREVEKFFGRRLFLTLYGGIYLLQPLVLTAIGWWQPTQLSGQSGGFALFIAFAALYPNVAIFFNLLAKWVAIILVALYTLIAIGNREETGLISLWTTTGFAFAFVRYQQGVLALPKLRFRRSSSAEFGAKKFSDPGESKNSPAAEVDLLLDKIARSGFGSLTAKERARLDAARAAIIKRGSRNG